MSDDDVKIVAVVMANGKEWYVLNRHPKFLYERKGDLLIAKDGPFTDVYGYDPPVGRFKAFAGREFDIPMKDGTAIRATGQWWHIHIPEAGRSYGISTVEQLLKCYVFSSAQLDAEWLEKARSEYSSGIYPYRDYEKVIRYDVDRKKWWEKQTYWERSKRALISQARRHHGNIITIRDTLRAATTRTRK